VKRSFRPRERKGRNGNIQVGQEATLCSKLKRASLQKKTQKEHLTGGSLQIPQIIGRQVVCCTSQRDRIQGEIIQRLRARARACGGSAENIGNRR